MHLRPRRASLLSLTIVTLLSVLPLRADLIGDVIKIEHFYPNLGANGVYETHTVAVTAGNADATNLIGVYTVNPEAESVLVDFFYGAADWSNTAFNGLVLSNIDDEVLNVSVDTNLAGWDASRLFFDATTIRANWAGLSIDHASYFNLHLTQAEPVPEHGATACLLVVAFAGLAWRHRRQPALH